jgi:membrane protein insertase Oxa1/YidC/SpoIIIJ
LVYWLVGNIVGFIQQFLINRWTKTDEEKALPEETKAKGKTGKKAPDNSQK